MRSRILSLALLLLPLSLSACQMPSLTGTPTHLSTIQYDYTDAMSTIEAKMLIDPDGRVRVMEMVGTDPPQVHRADTNLTEEQQAAVLTAFKDWKQLKPYYSATFGPVYTISFDGYAVEAADSEAAAPAVRHAKNVLDGIARAAMRDAPHPTVVPDTQPAVASINYALQSDIEYQFEYNISGAVLHRHISIARDDGLLKIKEETTGPEPHDATLNAKIHLTNSQLETLASTLHVMPDGDQRYSGLADGPYFSITYNGRKIISGGLPDTPSAVKSAQVLLEGYALDAKRFPEDN